MSPATPAVGAAHAGVPGPELGFPDCLDDYSRGQVDALVSVIEWLVDRYPAGGEPAVALQLVDTLGGRIQRYCELAGQRRAGSPPAPVADGDLRERLACAELSRLTRERAGEA